MNKICTLIVICITLIVSSCTKSTVLIKTEYFHPFGFAMTKNEWCEHGKNGQIVKMHNDGIKRVYTYSLGELDGLSDETFPFSDTIYVSKSYKTGILLAETFYYRTGLPYKEVTYFDDKMEVKGWYDDGAPMFREEFIKGFFSSAVYFNDMGDIDGEVVQQCGLRVIRNREGIKESEELIEKNQIICKSIFYDNGVCKNKIEYLQGKKNGASIFYTKTGEPYLLETYCFDQLDGLRIEYIGGFKVREMTFSDGKKMGIERVYFNNELIEEINWNAGLKDGPVKYYYNNILTRIDLFQRGILTKTELFS